MNRPPALPALEDILATAGQVVTLDGSGIFDPEGHLADVIWRVEASPLNPAAPVALDGQVAQFTPTLAGTYYVTVNATDDLGETDGTYLKLVVAKASAPVFEGNTIQDCKPGTPGLHVLNEDLVVQDTVIAGCSPGLKAEFNPAFSSSLVAPKRVVFADSQIANTSTVIQVTGLAHLDVVRADWEPTTLERQASAPVQDVTSDADGDQVKDFVEMYVRDTNAARPGSPDRDGDGVPDHDEIAGAIGVYASPRSATTPCVVSPRSSVAEQRRGDDDLGSSAFHRRCFMPKSPW